MKTITLKQKTRLLTILFFSLCITISFSQVGINTTTPNGILDVSSTEYGVVLPRIALTSANDPSPLSNPQGGGLKVGTVVYNTATTSNGTNDVSPGIYVWTGIDWYNEFTKKQAEFFTQSNYLRPESSAGIEDIPGLTNETFTAKYTGTYKIELSVNYGGGILKDIDGDSSLTDVAVQTGDFDFEFDGDSTILPAKAYSVQGATNYYLIWEQYSIVVYKELIAGQDYNINLSFDQDPSPEFINNGDNDSGIGFYEQGTGYIGFDIPCSVEIIYLGE